MIYRLNSAQRFLLQSLVHFVREGKLKEPIGTFPVGNPPTAYVIHLRGQDSFVFENIGDLDVLCRVGLLGFQWNRTGMGKLYFVTEAGETAVLQNFQTPQTLIGFDAYLPDVIHAMSGGQLIVKGLPEIALSEVVTDIKLRRQVVEALVERLVTAVHTLLNKENFTTYKVLTGQFANYLLHTPTTEKELKTIYHRLSFWEDLLIETKYMTQIQPLLYVLWLITAVRIEELRNDHK